MDAHLKGKKGKYTDLVGKIESGRLTIGREVDNHLVLPEEMISAHHAEIVMEGEKVTLRDLESTNGTFVNGKRVKEMVLRNGDVVSFDVIEFDFVNPGESKRTMIRPAMQDEKPAPPKTAIRQAVPDTPKASLKIRKGPEPGKTFAITGKTVVVGRDTGDFLIADETVSGRHCEIAFEGGKYLIRDLGSLNGVFVGGEKVKEIHLTGGEEIRLGDVRILFELDDPGKKTAIAAPAAETEGVSGLAEPEARESRKKSMLAAAVAVIAIVAVGTLAYRFFGGGKPRIEKVQINRLWEFAAADKIRSSPAVGDVNGDGNLDILVGDWAGNLYAVNGPTGQMVWAYRVPAANILSSPGVVDLSRDGRPDIVFGAGNGKLYALDGSMKKLWESQDAAQAKSVSSSPAFAHLNEDNIRDAVYGTGDGQLYAIEGRRGWLIWKMAEPAKGEIFSTPALADLDGDGIPDAVVGSADGKLRAVNGKTGWMLWTFEARGGINSSPSLVDVNGDGVPDAIVGSEDGGVYAVNGKTGTELWRATLAGAVNSSPVVADLNGDKELEVAVGDASGAIYGLSIRTGQILWKNKDARGPIYASPTLYDVNRDGTLDVIVPSLDGKLYIVDGRNGWMVASYDLGGPSYSSPVLADINADGYLDIVLGTDQKTLLALTVNSPVKKGEVPWSMFRGNILRTGVVR